MVARAMANMGATDLVLVNPERWEKEKAVPLATAQGQELLDSARVETDLESARASGAAAFGTIARQGERVALVFGSEDRGLLNAEVEQCTRLVNIPTVTEHSSLNLAQAAMVLLYECVKADMALPFASGSVGRSWTRPSSGSSSRRASLAEESLLLCTLEETLLAIGHLPQDNPGWFMQPMRRFIRKSHLRRHEFDMIIGNMQANPAS